MLFTVIYHCPILLEINTKLMTTKTLLYGIISSVLFNACVSKKVFTDLEEKYKLLKDEYEQLGDTNDNLTSSLDQSKQDLQELKEQYDKAAILERNSLQSAFDTSQLNLKISKTLILLSKKIVLMK